MATLTAYYLIDSDLRLELLIVPLKKSRLFQNRINGIVVVAFRHDMRERKRVYLMETIEAPLYKYIYIYIYILEAFNIRIELEY